MASIRNANRRLSDMEDETRRFSNSVFVMPQHNFTVPVAHIRHGHDRNADSLFIQFDDGTQLAIVLRPPARLRDARVMYFRDEGEVALALEDLLLPSRPN